MYNNTSKSAPSLEQESPIKQGENLYMGVVDKEKLDQLVLNAVNSTIEAGEKGKNELIMLSGGSASSVGTCVELLKEMGITNKNSTLQLDSEAILASKIMPATNEIEKMGYKHAEKFPRYRYAFREILKYATELYYYELDKYNQENATSIKGAVVVDDHFEKVETATELARIGKKYDADVGYIGVYVDPRVALARAAVRSSDGKDVVAPSFQIGTYKNLPDNWDTLCKDKNVDVTVLVHNNREASKVPQVIAKKTNGKVDVLNPLEYYCFQAMRDIKAGAKRSQDVFGDRDLEFEFIEKNKSPENSFASLIDNTVVGVRGFVERLVSTETPITNCATR